MKYTVKLVGDMDDLNASISDLVEIISIDVQDADAKPRREFIVERIANRTLGRTATVELKDKEAVRRLFQNHGFWDGGKFYAASAIYSITPFVEKDTGE